jgi:hypothetical protein
MYVHGNAMHLNGANLHSIAAAEKAGSAQRAAEVRKKLLSGGMADGLNPDAVAMIGRWSEGGAQGGRRQGDAGHFAHSDAAEEREAGQPVSVWV